MPGKEPKNPKAPVPPQGFEPKQPLFPQDQFVDNKPPAPNDHTGAAMKALEEKRKKKRRNKRIKIIVAVLVIVALLGVAIASLVNKMTSNEVAKQKPTETVTKGEFKKVITTSGVLQPNKNQSVNAEVSGTVKQVMVAAGDTVQAGDVLFTYESPELEQGIRQAEMAVKEAQNGVKAAKMNVKGAINGYNKAVDQYNEALYQQAVAQDQALQAQAQAKAQAAIQQAAAEQAAARAAVINSMVQDYQRSKEQKAVFDQLVASNKAERGMTFEDAYKMIDSKQKAGGNVTWAKTQLEKAQVKPDGTKYKPDEKIATIDKYWMNALLTKSQLMAMGIDPDNPQSMGALGADMAGMPGMDPSQMEGQMPTGSIPPFDKEGLEQTIEQARMSVDSARTSLEAAQDNLQLAKDRYNDGKVTAKISGQIVELNIEDGSKLESLIQGGKPAVQIADVSQMKAQINVNELDILKVTKDLVADLTFTALPDYTAHGKVASIASSPTSEGAGIAGAFGGGSPLGGAATGNAVTYPVSVTLDNPDPRLKVGMTVEVALTLEQLDDVLMVPLAAVNNDGESYYVTRVTFDEKGVSTPEKVPVKVITSNEQVSVVEGDLKEGDTVEISFDEDPSPLSVQMG